MVVIYFYVEMRIMNQDVNDKYKCKTECSNGYDNSGGICEFYINKSVVISENSKKENKCIISAILKRFLA
jgi:hypothetical protein